MFLVGAGVLRRLAKGVGGRIGCQPLSLADRERGREAEAFAGDEGASTVEVGSTVVGASAV